MSRITIRFILAFGLCAVQPALYAGGDLVIEGRVTDAYSKAAVADAHVFLEEIRQGTATDRRGGFSFPGLDPGTYTLRVQHVSYPEYELVLTLDSSIQNLSIILFPRIVQIDPVTVTATLTENRASEVPARVARMPASLISQVPANTTDGLLSGIANVYVHRPWGIFSKSASVSMRGLPGSARTLILLDGVPMNKTAGGAVIWNFIEPGNIEDIEVVKGPSSAIYGNNAMTGVVSINTKKPQKAFEGRASILGGSLGTFGGSLGIGGARLDKGRGLYWKINASGRRGDGYINEPGETRDSTDANVDLAEYKVGALVGYRIDSSSALDISYRHYHGKFGTGRKVFEDEGDHDMYNDHLLLAAYNGMLGSFSLSSRVYYQLENFDRQSENINRSGKYKLSDTRIAKNDYGLWMNISRSYFRKHRFTAGFEIKTGDMDARQVYRTSTDDVRYGGRLLFAGLFIQDEYAVLSKLSLIAGLRFDMAAFYQGFQEVYNPTSNTGFIRNISDEFGESSWSRLSPKIALQYQLRPQCNIYASFSTGFMPPKIDDLARSGKISKGFKLANPGLKPESLTSYELGMNWKSSRRFSLEPSVYYSRGADFQYFVATGDSVETGGSSLKPVLQRQNVSEVEILGAELTATYAILDNLVLTANYSINDSRILEFSDPSNSEKDITGNGLIEVPRSMAYASLSWRNTIVNVLINWEFTGKEWYDDENTQYIEPHHRFNIKLNKTLPQRIGISLSIVNIFEDMTIDRKGKLPPGRFITGELSYEL